MSPLTPGSCGCHFENVIFKLILCIDIVSIFLEIAVHVNAAEPIDDKSSLALVMAWCRNDGTKPSPEPMLTLINGTIWCH